MLREVIKRLNCSIAGELLKQIFVESGTKTEECEIIFSVSKRFHKKSFYDDLGKAIGFLTSRITPLITSIFSVSLSCNYDMVFWFSLMKGCTVRNTCAIRTVHKMQIFNLNATSFIHRKHIIKHKHSSHHKAAGLALYHHITIYIHLTISSFPVHLYICTYVQHSFYYIIERSTLFAHTALFYV